MCHRSAHQSCGSALELPSAPLKLTDSHSRLQYSCLGSPGTQPREPHRAHPTQSNQASPRRWHLACVTTHSGCPGTQSPEARSPLGATASPTYNGHLSTLPGRRQLAAKDCSGKAACCPEISDKWPSLSSPCPSKISRRKKSG